MVQYHIRRSFWNCKKVIIYHRQNRMQEGMAFGSEGEGYVRMALVADR